VAADAIGAALANAFGIEPVNPPLTSEGGDVVELRPKGRCPAPLVAPGVGLEPTTCGLTV
jgi:hypothetical protein